MRHIVRVGALAFVVAVGLGVAELPVRPTAAEDKTIADKAWSEFATRELQVENESTRVALDLARGLKPSISREPTFRLLDAYRASTQDPEVLKGTVAQIVGVYSAQRPAARSSAQISQLGDEAQLRLSVIQISSESTHHFPA